MQKVEEKLTIIRNDGPDKLHILADFDKTLTKATYQGKTIHSLISILYNEGYLTQKYQEAAQKLFATYHPIEKDPYLDIQTKKHAMQEWRSKHMQLLIQHKLSY